MRRVQGLSPSTRRNYLQYCRKFAAHYQRSPQELGLTEIRQFLRHVMQTEQVSCTRRTGTSWRR